MLPGEMNTELGKVATHPVSLHKLTACTEASEVHVCVKKFPETVSCQRLPLPDVF